MSAHRPARGSLRRDDRGISVVVGTILLIGLIVMTTVTIRVAYVPVWERDREAAHMRIVESQMASLKSELDRLLDNRTTVPVSVPISLASAGTSAFSSARPQAELRYTTDSKPFALASNRLLIHEENGTSFLGLDETWTDVGALVNVEDIAKVHSLRLRFDSLGEANAADAATLTLTDADSVFAGDLRVLLSAVGADHWRINVRVRDAASTTLVDQGITFANGDVQAPYWIDALRADYRFDLLLGSAKKPLKIALASPDTATKYAITYLQSSGGGAIIVGGGGLLRTDYQATHTGGDLTFVARNNRFPDQEFVLESGALVVTQADEGSVFKVDPGFRARLVGSVTSLTLTVPTLRGETTSFSGSTTATVSVQTLVQGALSAQAPRLTLTVTTRFPTLWSAFWTAELGSLPGYVAGTHYVVSTTATTAEVTVYGLTPDPLSTAYDLFLTLRQAQIAIEAKP